MNTKELEIAYNLKLYRANTLLAGFVVIFLSGFTLGILRGSTSEVFALIPVFVAFLYIWFSYRTKKDSSATSRIIYSIVFYWFYWILIPLAYYKAFKYWLRYRRKEN